MPDMDQNADVIQSTATSEEQQARILAHLASIENALKNLASGKATSQSSARDMQNNDTRYGDTFRQNYKDFYKERDQARAKKEAAKPKTFTEGIQQALLDGLLGSNFKKEIGKVFDDFSKAVGEDIKDIPGKLGKTLTKQALDAFKNTDLGKSVFSGIEQGKTKVKDFAINRVAPELKAAMSGKQSASTTIGNFANLGKDALSGTGSSIKNVGSKISEFSKAFAGKGGKFGNIVGKIGNVAGSGLGKAGGLVGKAGGLVGKAGATFTGAGGGMAGLQAVAGKAAAGLSKLGPYGLLAAAAIIAVVKTIKAFGPAIDGVKKLFAGLKKAGDRYNESRKQNLELEKKRLRDDVETIIKKPFEIIEAAAQKAYDVWDNNLRIISATQGYNKADVQDLMAAYASRIRSEGLSDVVNAADITQNLTKVLEAGLSGPVAEEFAYLATKLNAAIPTQDFFAYASDYAALIANAQQMGMSQAEAVEKANSAIETYASNILYASRQLTGGVTTGLQNAQSLFNEAVKITQTSRTGDVNQISGVLASISAVIGAIAPDLASSITELVTKAATGGNNSQIVALRSLAGVNASNTEFLRKLATDPKSIFVELFTNLGQMQKMSEGAYMEVAEGLSDVFGVSMEALARVDFNYLAQSISEMNVSNAALDENMKLLASGQTTLNAEQLKNAQINKYMIEEGLSYVLDNEAARAIQQHMWDEQMARELMEATYSVELKGAALDFLEGIKQTVNNIINILNPFAWIGKLVNMKATADEASAHEKDIAQVLALGRVGNGALTAGEIQQMYNLTTRNRDLNIVPHLVNLMGGSSAYESVHAGLNLYNSLLGNPGMTGMELGQDIWRLTTGPATYATIGQALRTIGTGTGSRYTWKDLRKSTSNAVSSMLAGGGAGIFDAIAESATSSSQSGMADRLNQMLDQGYIDSFIKSGKGYDEWAATAGKYGIRDLESAIKEAGYTQQQIEGYFAQQQTEQGKEEKKQEALDQQDFRDKGRRFWLDQLSRMDTTIENITVTNSLLQAMLDGQIDFFNNKFANWTRSWESFYTKWVNYFVEHQYYTDRTGLDYSKIRAQEHAESNGAIYALAEAFNQGVADISDPTVQTNALLGKILLVVSSIMQQNAARGGTALTDTLNALAMGLTTPV